MSDALDPRKTAKAKFLLGAPKREKYIYALNHLEPPWPYRIVPFIPGVFGLDSLQDFVSESRQVVI